MTPTPAAPGRARSLVRWVATHPAARHHRVAALARLAGWQLWWRATGRPWPVRLPGGCTLTVRPGSSSATAALYVGLPEWPHMPFLLDYLRPGDTFVDVGANVGTYALLAAGVPGVSVVAYEPSSLAFVRLCADLERNRLADRVVARRAAVGAATGTARLTVGLDTRNHLTGGDADGGTGASGGRGADATEEVDVVALDDDPLLAGRTVAVIKVDVEGAEDDVLAGAARLRSSAMPVLIVEANDPDRLAARLEPDGYRPVHYDADRRTLHPARWDDPQGRNLLVVPDLAAAQARLAGALRTGDRGRAGGSR